ncbi:MAG: hypothetical protein WAM85_04435, partial [Terracidiphilus sp.]
RRYYQPRCSGRQDSPCYAIRGSLLNTLVARDHIDRWRGGTDRGLNCFLVPGLGFLISTFVWSRTALVLGVVRMTAGISQVAIRALGFRANRVTIDIPADQA